MECDESYCLYCLRKLDKIFIECTDCPHILLCLDCFCSGAEAGSHKKNHGYRFKSKSAGPCIPIFGGWDANEELRLLEALEHYGVGNWEDVSLKVETKSPIECMDHYTNYYLNGILGCDLSSHNIPKSGVTDHTISSNRASPLPSSPSVYVEVEDQQLLGYMPARGDFERDYDNDAESILCRLHPSFSHDDLENALKVAQVGIYMQRLRERQRRKEIAQEHSLVAPILAFILNKRIRRYTPGSKKTVLRSGSRRSRGRPSSPQRHLQLNKHSNQKATPIKRTSLDTFTCSEAHSSSPPPGSWLAAPFYLKSSGATRGTPIVASGLTNDVQPSGLASPSHLGSSRVTSLVPLREKSFLPENFSVFSLNDKLKPFLRYFTGPQGKRFMDNLYREELLKFEIKYLMDCHAKGKVKLTSACFKMPVFKSLVYTALPKPVPTGGSRGKRLVDAMGRMRKRRHRPATPWYLKVQRRARQARQ